MKHKTLVTHDIFKSLAYFLLLPFYMTGCSLDIPYENKFSDPTAIATIKEAEEFFVTAYDMLPINSYEFTLLSDDVEPTHIMNKSTMISNILTWQEKSLEELSANIWETYYGVIALCNATIERTEKLKSVSSEEDIEKADNIISEAKALKAYSYLQLYKCFSNLYDEENGKGIIIKKSFELQQLSRHNPKESIREIKKLLKESYEKINKQSSVERIGKAAVTYMLSEVELYAGNFKESAKYALETINLCGGYATLSAENYSNLWKGGYSGEAIFSKFINNSFYTILNDSRETGDYVTVNREISNSLSNEDIRRKHSLYTQNVAGDKVNTTVEYHFLGKYNAMNKEEIVINYKHNIRLAGAVFILLESYCMDNDIHVETITEIMNKYLYSRRAQQINSAITKEEMIRLISEERRKEYVGEGDRFYQLKRLRNNTLKNWSEKPHIAIKGIKSNSYKWNMPIPKSEYLHNKNIEQNEGWKKLIQQ